MKCLKAIGGVDSDLVARAAPRDQVAKRRSFLMSKKAMPVAACLLFALALFGILKYGGSNGVVPHGGGLGQPAPGSFLSQSGAVYHNLDPAQITGQSVEAKVPAEFWFRFRLAAAQLNKADVLAKWDGQTEFTKADIESQLDLVVRDPELPEGDYTAAGSVLRDVRTDEIIAYAIDYIYFDPATMAFISSYTVFYFDAGFYDAEKITGTQEVTLEQGDLRIDVFSPPTEAYGKVPHVRSLVFFDGGKGIAVEAMAHFVPAQDGTVDQESSLELYKKTDTELVEMMKSLIR